MLVKTMLETFLNIEVTGMDLIPPEGGGIIVCNHTDLMDVPIQAVYSPRKLIYLGKVELFEPDREIKQWLFKEGSPLNLPGLSLFKGVIEKGLEAYSFAQKTQLLEWGGHPVVRNFKGEGAREAVEYYQELEKFMVDLLKQGNFLSIYPEGTRSETGLMGPFKHLTAKLAIRAQVPIVPSGIGGAFQLLTPASILSGRFFKSTVRYNVGQPVYPKDFPPGDEKRSAKELTAFLEKQVYALSMHQERRQKTRARVL